MGCERGQQLFSGWDRLKYCSVLTRQKWKIRIKLAALGETNQSLPSGVGGVGKLGDNEDREGRTTLPSAGPRQAQEQEVRLSGLDISLAWSGLSPCEVSTFGPGGVGVSIPSPLSWGGYGDPLLSVRIKVKHPRKF